MNEQRQSDQFPNVRISENGSRPNPDDHAIILSHPNNPADLPESFGSARSKASDLEAFGNPTRKKKKPEPDRKDPGEKEKDHDHERNNEDDQEKKAEGDEKEKESTEDEEASDKKKSKDIKSGVDDKDQPQKPPIYKRPLAILLFLLILAVLILAAILYWLYARQYVSTDDAYIDGHATLISPQIAAPIKLLHIDDNQLVHSGDLLVELDPTDYQVALDQAQAGVASAQGKLIQSQSQITVAQAAIPEADAQIDAAQVALDNAAADLKRYQTVDPRARSQQQLDNATANFKSAQAQLEQAKAKKVSAQANVQAAKAAVKAAAGDLQQANASVEKAQTNLGYTKILAPSDGRITQRTVENGAYVTPGQTLFTLVSPQVWVTANFKETQLTHMRPGQPVEIKIDAYPDKKFRGHIDSIQAGSGARFSVLPAENATGNFVKIVQRVPVKILFDSLPDNTPDAHLLSPGLSVTPKVKVR